MVNYVSRERIVQEDMVDKMDELGLVDTVKEALAKLKSLNLIPGHSETRNSEELMHKSTSSYFIYCLLRDSLACVVYATKGKLQGTKVLDVEWNVSKDGRLKPRVLIKPVHILGSKISAVTGYNGKFIFNNKVGKGANIIIIKSGDIIPNIFENRIN